MKLHVDLEPPRLAHNTVSTELPAEHTADDRSGGHVGSSPVATAVAISALVVARRRVEFGCCGMPGTSKPSITFPLPGGEESALDAVVDGPLSELVVDGLHWLARVQNADGGWGDYETAKSNLTATALVLAAFRLTGVPARYADLIVRADAFIAAQGGLGMLRLPRDGDRTWAAPELSNCALAEMLPWRKVPTVAFECYCDLPWGKWLYSVPQVESSQAIAMQLACGRAKLHHAPPRNPLVRILRRSCQEKSLTILERLQAADGSFHASPVSTAFVVMNLAGSGLREHPVVQTGIEFLLASVRADGTWPAVTDRMPETVRRTRRPQPQGWSG